MKKNLPPIYGLKRYYLPDEIAHHNSADDCWVSLFNQVYDLTKLIAEHYNSPLCDPLILAAGTDITHWFDPETREPIKYANPDTGRFETFCPTGRYLHVPDPKEDQFDLGLVMPWWQDVEQFVIGKLTKKPRKINILNTLTKEEQIMIVAQEETINEILDRYLIYNSHAFSYTWKRLGRVLNMN